MQQTYLDPLLRSNIIAQLHPLQLIFDLKLKSIAALPFVERQALLAIVPVTVLPVQELLKDRLQRKVLTQHHAQDLLLNPSLA